MLKKTMIASVLSMGILAGMGSSVLAVSENANQLASQYRIAPDGGYPTTENGLFLGHYCAPVTHFDYDDHIVFGTRVVPKKESSSSIDPYSIEMEVQIFTGNGEQLLTTLSSRTDGEVFRASIDPTREELPPGDYKFKFKATSDNPNKENKDILIWEAENNTFTLVDEDIPRPPLSMN